MALFSGHEDFSVWAKTELSGSCSTMFLAIEQDQGVTAWANERMHEKCAGFNQSMLEEVNSLVHERYDATPRGLAQRKLDMLVKSDPENTTSGALSEMIFSSGVWLFAIATSVFTVKRVLCCFGNYK